MSAASAPRSTRAGDVATGRTRGRSVSGFLSLAPALLAGVLLLRLWSLWMAAAAQPLPWRDVAAALGEDLLVLGRSLPLLFLVSWPLLRLRNARWRIATLAVVWSAWLAVQVALEQYFLATRVPLGADLFGYSVQEIATTVAGGARMDAMTVAGWLLPLGALLTVLFVCAGHARPWRAKPAVIALLACALLWLVPLPSTLGHGGSEDLRNLACNKLGHFAGDSLRYWTELSPPAAVASAATPADAAADPGHPFLRREQAADVLGPYFAKGSAQPPHLVFIIVEGLGRSFSGPGAPRGSFTPFLDQLGERSLYWSNFLAPQGRTFGVLPSVFGSLPFADQGFAALGERMPAHAGLFNVLARQGYATRFYAGTDLTFDNERAFLQREEPRRDHGDEHLRAHEIENQAGPCGGGLRQVADLKKGEHEKKGEVGEQGDDGSRDRFLARHAIAEIEEHGVCGGKQERMRAKSNRRGRVADQSCQQGGNQAVPQARHQRAEGDEQASDPHVNMRWRQYVIQLRDEGPQESQRGEEDGGGTHGRAEG